MKVRPATSNRVDHLIKDLVCPSGTEEACHRQADEQVAESRRMQYACVESGAEGHGRGA